MGQKYFVRHAKSFANKGDFTAFDNRESPLVPDRGIEQAGLVGDLFRWTHGIDPTRYNRPVAASTYRRAMQTAEVAGFRAIEEQALLDEAVFTTREEALKAVAQHAIDGSIPDELAERVDSTLDSLRSGVFNYEILFSHGLFIAGIKKRRNEEAVAAGLEPPYIFIPTRGYIPALATITVVEVG